MTYDLLVVGSGPVGSTFARVVAERLPDARILLVEAGLVLTDPPGLNLKNLDDEAELAKARELSQGPPGARPGAVDMPSSRGRSRRARGRTCSSPEARACPPPPRRHASAGWVHTGRARPRGPFGSERIPFIPEHELDAALDEAERILSTTTMAFAESAQGAAIRARLAAVFDEELPAGRKVDVLPVAARADGGRVVWTGVDTILEPLPDRSSSCVPRRSVAGSSSTAAASPASSSRAGGRASARRSRRRSSSSQPTRSERRSSSEPRGSARPPSAATSPSTPSRSPSSSSTRSSSRRARSRASSSSTRCYP